MRSPFRSKNKLTGLTISLLALGLTAASSAQASPPTVNGLFYGDGDHLRYPATPYGVSAGGSEIFVTLVDTTVYVALIVNRRVNDNVFSSVAAYRQNVGWNPPRTANRLIDSEFAEFTLTVGSGAAASSWTWKQGYAGGKGALGNNFTNENWVSDTTVSGGGGTPPPGIVSSSSMAWNMKNYAYRVNNSIPTGWNMGTAGTPSSWTSPITNPSTPNVVINADEGYPGPSGNPPVGSAKITYSPTYQWEWAMVYEWAVDLAQFDDIPAFVITGLSHHSPAKNGDQNDAFDFGPDGPPPLSDFGDLPAPYPTLWASGGPRHAVDPKGVRLGSQIDTENDGQPHAHALGDDLAGAADDDGVVFLTPLLPGKPAKVQVTISNKAGHLSAFADFNGDGTLTPVTLLSATGPATITAGTLGDRSLAATGVYVLTIDVPSNATGTVPSRWRVTNNAGQGGNAVGGAAISGEVEDYMLAGLGNLVWNDTNKNGIRDSGEPGLNGVTVRLLDASGNAVLDGNGDPVTATTAGGGLYSFPGLPTTSGYRVEVVAPAGYAFSPKNADGQGLNGASNSDVDPATGRTDAITLSPGQINNNVAAGLYQAFGTVSGHVFYDLNGNAVQDAGEPNLPNVSVVITDAFGGQTTVSTDANGDYSAMVAIGSTTASVDLTDPDIPAGSVLTTANAIQSVTVLDGQNTNTTDVGFQPRGRVTGHVFLDINGNAVQDAGEPNLSDVDVVVTDPHGVEVTVSTDSNGDYSTWVAIGDVTASVVLSDPDIPAGSVLTTANAVQTVTVLAGETTDTTDVGFQPRTASLAGLVWRDMDGSKARELGEGVFEGVLVRLDYAGPDGIFGTADDSTWASTTTGTDGRYSFTELPAGEWRVVLPNGSPAVEYILTTDALTLSASLAVGQHIDDLDFGFGPPILVKSDALLLHDNNGNGQLDGGDVVYYTITLTNVSTTTGFTTDLFDLIPPGFSLYEILTAPDANRSLTTSSALFLEGIDVPPAGTITVIYTLTPCPNLPDGTFETTSACIDMDGDSGYEICDAGSIGPISGTPPVIATIPSFCSESALISTVSGNGWGGYTGDNIPATTGQHFFPLQASADAFGNLYVADTSNHIVRRIDAATGILTTVAGTPNTAGYAGDGAAATAARLRLPADVHVQGERLYIADKGNSVIRLVDLDTGIITTVAGNGTQGASGDGGPATAAQLDRPNAVLADAAGNIYIADTFNFAIRRVDASTGTISTIAGTLAAHGHGPDGSVAAGSPLEWVMDLALTPGCVTPTLYFSEQNGYNLIRRIVDGKYETIIGQAGSSNFGDCGPGALAQLKRPVGIAFDSNGDLYIADRDNHKVRKVNMATGLVATFAGTGVAGFSGDGGIGIDARLNTPTGLAVGPNNVLYIVDSANHRIRSMNLNAPEQPVLPDFPDAQPGLINIVAGTGASGYNGDGTYGWNARLNHPARFAVAPNGDVILADFSNHRIRRIYASNWMIATIGGTGERGLSGDGGSARTARIAFPVDVALDANGNIYFTDQGNNMVRRIDAATGTISRVAGTGTNASTGDGGPALDANLAQPDGIAFRNGALFVSERASGNIRRIDLVTGLISTVGAGLISPRGLDVDPAGNILVAELGAHRVRLVSAADGSLATLAGHGLARYEGDGGPALWAGLSQPMDVAFDRQGGFFIADSRNHVIRHVNALGTITTTAGAGIAGKFQPEGPALETHLSEPWGVGLTPAGDLLISDRFNHRIRAVGIPPAGSGSTGNKVVK
jgi:uncharacterized repeat protein (TIGR01451 family)